MGVLERGSPHGGAAPMRRTTASLLLGCAAAAALCCATPCGATLPNHATAGSTAAGRSAEATADRDTATTTPAEGLVHDLSANAVDYARRSLREVEGVALRLRSNLKAEGANCTTGNLLPAGLCATRVEGLRSKTYDAKAAHVISTVYREVFQEGTSQLHRIQTLDELNQVDLDVDEPEVDKETCSTKSLEVDPDSAACLPEGQGCWKTAIASSLEMVQLERLSFAFLSPFDLVSRAAEDISNALTHGIASYEFSKEGTPQPGSLRAYLFAKLKQNPTMYWAYVADKASGTFIGYKRLRLADTSSEHLAVFTYGDHSGLRFYEADAEGRRGEFKSQDLSWSLHDTHWWVAAAKAERRSLWTELYSFAPPGEGDVGISHVTKWGDKAVIGVDFYLNDMAHSLIDDVDFQRGTIVFILNEYGQLVTSNKISGVHAGKPLSYQDIAHPQIRQVAERVVTIFPSVTDPEDHDLERRELEGTRGFSMTIGKELFHVGVKAVEESVSDRVAGLRWTLVHMLPDSDSLSRPLEKTTEDGGKCVTTASCTAMHGGDILRWRTAQIDVISESLSFASKAAEACREGLATDIAAKASIASDPASALPFLTEKLLANDQVSYIHIADVKKKTIFGVQREGPESTHPGRITALRCAPQGNVTCAAPGAARVLLQGGAAEGGGVGVAGSAVSNLTVDWGYWEDALALPVGEIADFASPPYTYGGNIAKAFLYRVPGDPNVVVNVGVTQAVWSRLLQGENPQGTVSFVVDSRMTVIAASVHGVERDALNSGSLAVDGASEIVKHGMGNLHDTKLRRGEIVVDDSPHDIDYKMIQNSGFASQRHKSYFWVLVTVRNRHQRASTGSHGVSILRKSTDCHLCMDADVEVESRRQTLTGMADEADAVLMVPPRAILMFDAYVTAGFLKADPEDYHEHAMLQLVRDSRLLWAGVFVRAGSSSNYDFYGALRDPQTGVANRVTNHEHIYKFVGLAKTLLLRVDTTPIEHLWTWTDFEDMFGVKDVLTAVRPKGKNGILEAAFAAGIAKSTLQAGIFTETTKEETLVVVDHYGDVVFHSDGTAPAEADRVKRVFYKAHPRYTGVAAAPWMKSNPDIDVAQDGESTITGMAYRHTSPAWTTWSPGSSDPTWVQWTFLTLADSKAKKNNVCLLTGACRGQLRATSFDLSKQLVVHVRDQVGEAFRLVYESVTTEFSDTYINALQTWDGVERVRKFLAYHLALYRPLDAMFVQATDSDSFVGIVRKPNAKYHPGKTTFTYETFDDFLTVECHGKVCDMNEVTPDGYKGKTNVLDSFKVRGRIQVDASVFRDYMAETSQIVLGQTSEKGLRFTSSGYSTATLRTMLRRLDVPIETNLMVAKVDPSTWNTQLIATNKDGSDPLFSRALNALMNWRKGLHEDPSGSLLEQSTFRFRGALFDTFIGFQKGYYVAAFRKADDGTTVVANFDVGLKHDTTCAEQGFCEGEVDRLRELSYAAKAHFIELRTRKYLTALESAVNTLASDVDAGVTVFPEVYNPTNPIIAAVVGLAAQKRSLIGGIRFAGAKSSILVLDSRDLLFTNDSGAYVAVSGAQKVVRRADASWDLTHLDAAKQPGLFDSPLGRGPDSQQIAWKVEAGISVFRKTTAGVFAMVSPEALVADNCLKPFEGIVMKHSGEHVVSNTRCQEEVGLLQDKALMNSILYDTSVGTVNHCSVDLRPIHWRGGHISLVVGSLEPDVHENDYPTVASAYACVTWPSCRVAIDAAEYKLLDTTLLHIHEEFKLALAELLSVSDKVSIQAQLHSARHLSLIADASAGGSFAGHYISKDFKPSGDVVIKGMRSLRCLPAGTPASQNGSATGGCGEIGVFPLGQYDTPEFSIKWPSFPQPGADVIVTGDWLAVRRGNLVAAIRMESLTAGISSDTCKVAFSPVDPTAEEEYARGSVGVLLHSTASVMHDASRMHIASDRQEAFVRATTGIVITASHTSSYIAIPSKETCVMDCDEDIHLFQGLDLAGAAASFTFSEVIRTYKLKLAFLQKAIQSNGWVLDVDREVPLPDPQLLCQYDTHPYGEASVGWFDGRQILMCIRGVNGSLAFISGKIGTDGKVMTKRMVRVGERWREDRSHETHTPMHWVDREETEGSVYAVRILPTGGHLAMRVATEALSAITPDSSYRFVLKRNGRTVFGDAPSTLTQKLRGYRQVEETVVIPSVSGHALWSLVVYTEGWAQLETPASTGCFTVRQCQCQKESMQASYTGLLKTLHRAIYTATVGNQAMGYWDSLNAPEVLEGLDAAGLKEHAVVGGLTHLLITSNAERSYRGAIRRDFSSSSSSISASGAVPKPGGKVGGAKPPPPPGRVGHYQTFSCNASACLDLETGEAIPDLPTFGSLHKVLRITTLHSEASAPEGGSYDLTGAQNICRRIVKRKAGVNAPRPDQPGGALDPSTAPDYVHFGVGFERITAGLVKLQQSAPSGGEMFVLGGETRDLLVDVAASAGLPSPDAGDITARCARKVQGHGRDIGSSDAEGVQRLPHCGYKGQAYTMVVSGLNDLILVGIIPRLSRAPSQQLAERQGSNLNDVAFELRAALSASNQAVTAVTLTSAETGNTLVAYIDYKGEHRTAFRAGLEGRRGYLRRLGGGRHLDLWFDTVSEAMDWRFEGAQLRTPGPVISGFLRVTRGDRTMGFVSAEFAAGDNLNVVMATALLADLNPVLSASLKVVDAYGRLVANAPAFLSELRPYPGYIHSPDGTLYNDDGIQITPNYNGSLTALSGPLVFPEKRHGGEKGNTPSSPLSGSPLSALLFIKPEPSIPAERLKAGGCVEPEGCEQTLRETLHQTLRQAAELYLYDFADMLYATVWKARYISSLPPSLYPLHKNVRGLLKLLEEQLIDSPASYLLVETEDNSRIGVFRVGDPNGVQSIVHVACADYRSTSREACLTTGFYNATAGEINPFHTVPSDAFQADFTRVSAGGLSLYLQEYGLPWPTEGNFYLSYTRPIFLRGASSGEGGGGGEGGGTYLTSGLTRAGIAERVQQLVMGNPERVTRDTSFTLVDAAGRILYTHSEGAVGEATEKVVSRLVSRGVLRKALDGQSSGDAEGHAYVLQTLPQVAGDALFILLIMPVPSLPALSKGSGGRHLSGYIAEVSSFFHAHRTISSIEVSTDGRSTIGLYRNGRNGASIFASGDATLGVDLDAGDGSLETIQGGGALREKIGCFFEGFGQKRSKRNIFNQDTLSYGTRDPHSTLDICVSKTTEQVSQDLSAWRIDSSDPQFTSGDACLFVAVPDRGSNPQDDSTQQGASPFLAAPWCLNHASGAAAVAALGSLPEQSVAAPAGFASPPESVQVQALAGSPGMYVSHVATFTPFYAGVLLTPGKVKGEVTEISAALRTRSTRSFTEEAVASATRVLGALGTMSEGDPTAVFAPGAPLEGGFRALVGHPTLEYVGVRRGDGVFFGFLRKTGAFASILFRGCGLQGAVEVGGCQAPKTFSVNDKGELGEEVRSDGGIPLLNTESGSSDAAVGYEKGVVRGLRVWRRQPSGILYEVGLAPSWEYAASDPESRASHLSFLLSSGHGGEASVVSAPNMTEYRALSEATQQAVAAFDPTSADASPLGSIRPLNDEFHISFLAVHGAGHLAAVELTPVSAVRIASFYLQMERSEFHARQVSFLAEVREKVGAVDSSLLERVSLAVTVEEAAERGGRADGIHVMVHVAALEDWEGDIAKVARAVEAVEIDPSWQRYYVGSESPAPDGGEGTLSPHFLQEGGDGKTGMVKQVAILAAVVLGACVLYLLFVKCVKKVRADRRFVSAASRGVPQPGYSENDRDTLVHMTEISGSPTSLDGRGHIV